MRVASPSFYAFYINRDWSSLPALHSTPSTMSSSSSTPGDQTPTEIRSPPSPPPPIAQSTSALLSTLPANAHQALAAVANPKPQKSTPHLSFLSSFSSSLTNPVNNPTPKIVSIKFRPLTSAPRLQKQDKVYKINSTQRFEGVVSFLKRELDLPASQTLYTYIGWSFVPALDEGVSGLWECFKDERGVLVVCYSMQSAFG